MLKNYRTILSSNAPSTLNVGTTLGSIGTTTFSSLTPSKKQSKISPWDSSWMFSLLQLGKSGNKEMRRFSEDWFQPSNLGRSALCLAQIVKCIDLAGIKG
jgi:hypothetical protein